MTVDETRLGKELEVARDARLGLAEDGGQVLDRELGLAQQRENAQPRPLARRLQRSQQHIDGKRNRGIHGAAFR